MTRVAPASTGPGPMAGTDPREAARIVMGECHTLPFLPELTDRGPGSDLLGRTSAMLLDLPVDISPRGWRLAGSPGRLARVAADLLDRDSDALEEADELVRDPEADPAEDERLLQVRIRGPWSLTAALELASGMPVLTDRGARRDVAASLAEGVSRFATGLAGRIRAGSRIILDEPLLWRVAAGTAPAPSTFDPVPAVPVDQMGLALCRFADSLRAGGVDEILLRVPTGSGSDAPALYTAFAEPPSGETALDGLCLAAEPLRQASSHDALDAAGMVLGAGRILQLEGSPAGPGWPDAPSEVEHAARALLDLVDRLSAPRYESLRQLTLTPTEEQMTGSAAAATRTLAGARSVAETAPRVAE